MGSRFSLDSFCHCSIVILLMSGCHIKVVHYDQFHHYGNFLALDTRVLLQGEGSTQWEKKARNGSLPPSCLVRWFHYIYYQVCQPSVPISWCCSNTHWSWQDQRWTLMNLKTLEERWRRCSPVSLWIYELIISQIQDPNPSESFTSGSSAEDLYGD